MNRRFKIRILGIDPGLATIGVALLEDGELLHCGVIETGKDTEHSERLLEIAGKLHEYIREWDPDETAVEQLFFSKNAKTAMKVSEARGVILMTVRESGSPVSEYTPVQVKQAVAGTGSADKEQVQKMVKILFRLKEAPKPDDAADAVAIAYCHQQNRKRHKLEESSSS